jgi:hypothetical protein
MCFRPLLQLSLLFQGRTFRRATPTAGTGNANWREQPGRAERPGTDDKRQGSPGASPLRGGSFRRALVGRRPERPPHSQTEHDLLRGRSPTWILVYHLW